MGGHQLKTHKCDCYAVAVHKTQAGQRVPLNLCTSRTDALFGWVQELQMKSGTPDGEEARLRRPESRTQQELAADSLIGSATSEILM